MDRAAHERAAMHHAATRYEPLPVERVITRSANHYSPARHEYVSRVAYRAEDNQARTFSSDQNRLVHEYRPSTAVHESTAATRQRHSPLREPPAEKKDKQVKFQ